MSGYPIWAVENARHLRAAGEPLGNIVQAVYEDTGRRPAKSTVLGWVDPATAQHKSRLDRRRHSAHSARGANTGGRLGTSRYGPRFKFARVVALRDAGLSVASIARVMSFDFEPITRAQVEHALEVGHYPKRLS